MGKELPKEKKWGIKNCRERKCPQLRKNEDTAYPEDAQERCQVFNTMPGTLPCCIQDPAIDPWVLLHTGGWHLRGDEDQKYESKVPGPKNCPATCPYKFSEIGEKFSKTGAGQYEKKTGTIWKCAFTGDILGQSLGGYCFCHVLGNPDQEHQLKALQEIVQDRDRYTITPLKCGGEFCPDGVKRCGIGETTCPVIKVPLADLPVCPLWRIPAKLLPAPASPPAQEPACPPSPAPAIPTKSRQIKAAPPENPDTEASQPPAAMVHRIIQGDVMDGLQRIPSGLIQCVITSIPYYQLRNYGIDGQIGLEDSLTEYLDKIVKVFREVRRVLRDDGTVFLNIGDCYAGSGKGPTGKNGIGDQTKRQGFHDPGTEVPDGLKSKDMMGVPWRVALALQDDGWYLRSDIVWSKPNPMPESVTDRPTKSHEYIFLLTKNGKYFYDADGAREPVSGNAHPHGNYKGPLPKVTAPGNGIRQNRSFSLATWASPEKKTIRKQDLTGNPTYTGFNERYKNKIAARSKSLSNHSGDLGSDGQPICDGITRNARTVWTIATQARPEAHFATFPDEIPRRCIAAGTSEYGCCPKCGAPYRRIIETSGGSIGQGSWTPHEQDDVIGAICGAPTKGYRREFKGWKPTCECNAGDPVPCVVLDPFWGTGTVTRKARDMGRSSVGIEINPEYVKIGRSLLQIDSQLDTGVFKFIFEAAKEQPVKSGGPTPGSCGTCGHHKGRKTFHETCPRLGELLFKGGDKSAKVLMEETARTKCEAWISKADKIPNITWCSTIRNCPSLDWEGGICTKTGKKLTEQNYCPTQHLIGEKPEKKRSASRKPKKKEEEPES